MNEFTINIFEDYLCIVRDDLGIVDKAGKAGIRDQRNDLRKVI